MASLLCLTCMYNHMENAIIVNFAVEVSKGFNLRKVATYAWYLYWSTFFQ